VALFCERSEAFNPDFVLTESNAPVVAEICRRLDGLPLALELAAAWTKFLSPERLRDRLERSLSLQAGPGRVVPGRHQTLRDAIAWSYDLLAPVHQAVFRRLSVFTGGATLDAIAAVCEVPGAEGDDVLPVVAHLVDQSLVVARPDPTGETRFHMLATIREFAREQLETAGEMQEPEQAFVDYIVRLAEEAAPFLVTQDRRRWLQRLAAEEDNIRGVLRLCLKRDWAEPAMRILSATFWSQVEHAREATGWLEAVLATPSGRKPSLARAGALNTAAFFRWHEGDIPGLRVYSGEAISLAREFGDDGLLAIVLGGSACGVENAEEREALFVEAFALARRSGERWVLDWCQRTAASLAQWFRRPERAITLAGEALATSEPRNTWHRSRLQAIRGQARLQLGEVAAARLEMRAAVVGLRETHETWTLLPVLLHLGIACALDDSWDEALAAFGEAGERALAGSEMQSLANAMTGLAVCLSQARQAADARLAFAVAEDARTVPGFPFVVPDPWTWLVSEHTTKVVNGHPVPPVTSRAEAARKVIAAARAVERRPRAEEETTHANPAGLSNREIEVLALIARGRSNKEIADHLFLSVRTVEKHVANIYGKAQINGRAEATLLATRMGLVQ
jgi:DNA-binding CsgD family transcriptional regulator